MTDGMTMELSSEDALRLNVLLANAKAVRIDEHSMSVFGLTDGGELKVPLNPNVREDQYLIRVREMLSSHVLDSPRGYPVYLRRWARMGQISNSPLDKLLMLGEPEAVVAVACAPNLTDELAARAWWCSPTSEVAQRMLENEAVADGAMGPVLAEYLAEFLPFETEADAMLRTVRLILRPGLIGEATRAKLWETGMTRKAYRVGFLEASPDRIPRTLPARADRPAWQPRLSALAGQGNAAAALLLQVLDVPGQTFIEACQDVMRRPMHQDIISALFNAIGAYFAGLRRGDACFRELDELDAHVDALLATSGDDTDIGALRRAVPALAAEIKDMLRLAHCDEALLIPILSRSDAMGTLLRKKIQPVSSVVNDWLAGLRTARA